MSALITRTRAISAIAAHQRRLLSAAAATSNENVPVTVAHGDGIGPEVCISFGDIIVIYIF